MDKLNVDPVVEMEEMILESKPIHKKSYRLTKSSTSPSVDQTPQVWLSLLFYLRGITRITRMWSVLYALYLLCVAWNIGWWKLLASPYSGTSFALRRASTASHVKKMGRAHLTKACLTPNLMTGRSTASNRVILPHVMHGWLLCFLAVGAVRSCYGINRERICQLWKCCAGQ